MAIEIRPTASAPSFSSGDFTNPLCLTFNGSMGGEQEQSLYIKNTSGSNVNVEIEITGGVSPAPYKVYLKKTFSGPWTQDSISFEPIDGNDTETFYVKVEVDPDTEVDNFDNLKIQVTETAP
tara:strand:- start:689 stop:1054 length:366 start_codon:yes stop_codon:yes gene_type:complete